jgi:hypothetical protein
MEQVEIHFFTLGGALLLLGLYFILDLKEETIPYILEGCHVYG